MPSQRLVRRLPLELRLVHRALPVRQLQRVHSQHLVPRLHLERRLVHRAPPVRRPQRMHSLHLVPRLRRDLRLARKPLLLIPRKAPEARGSDFSREMTARNYSVCSKYRKSKWCESLAGSHHFLFE
jgi:hypothetical protein